MNRKLGRRTNKTAKKLLEITAAIHSQDKIKDVDCDDMVCTVFMKNNKINSKEKSLWDFVDIFEKIPFEQLEMLSYWFTHMKKKIQIREKYIAALYLKFKEVAESKEFEPWDQINKKDFLSNKDIDLEFMFYDWIDNDIDKVV